MVEKLNWGVMGTGGIATAYTQALEKSRRGRVVNVTARTTDQARAFADKWRISTAAASVEELLADRGVAAVYISTPHPFHEQMALAAISAGKPVLCEKPLALDADATARVSRPRARRGSSCKKGVFLMEGYMYRCHPLMKQLTGRLREGIIGPIRHVRADFAFRVPRDPEGRLFAQLGGTVVFGEGGKSSKRQCLETSYTVHRDRQPPETVQIKTDKAAYAIEAELVADPLPAAEAAWPAMSWADTLGNMRVLDAWPAALQMA